ncbi:MAG: PAS domain S-box protein [Candidatus Acidiferrales bacterium]
MARTKKANGSGSPQVESSAYPGVPDDVRREELFDVIARSQRGFRELIDSFDRIAFNLSLDGRIQVINRRFADVVGLSFAAIVGHPLEEFIAEPSSEELARGLPHFLEKRFWAGVVPVRWKSKSEVRFYDCALYAVVKGGNVTGVSGLARDISLQREAESRFTDLFETLHEGVYFAAPSGELIDVNPAAVRMLGYESKEELLKQPVDQHFVGAAESAALWEELRRSGSVRDRELTLRRRDGAFIRVLNSGVAIRDAAGEFVRFQGSLVDITERRQMERRLREEQEFVRRLVACFPDIIVVLDNNGRYTFVSPRVQEFLGYTPDDYLGASLEARPHPDDRNTLLDFFRSLTNGEISFGTVEYRTAHKDGGWRTVRANANPLTNAEGRIIGVVASARDVTESKRLEQQLMQSEKLAAIGQMVSGVAHELNNPLTAILGVSDLLQERTADEASRRQVQLIHKQARKAAELVQGLLMFSRPSRHHSLHVRIADLIARAIELQKTELESRHIAVSVGATADLPLIDADPQHMTQVFVNLLSNAVQAIASVSDHGRISIHVTALNEEQEILIDDDGPGIRAEIRAKIFDPFFTTHRTSGGSGLGLTICLVIVKEHGGTIEAQTSPAGGGRFRILLPSAKGAATPAKTSSRSSPGDLKGRSILVVDDEKGIRELVEQGLTARGAVVDTVETGNEAWDRLMSRPYDLVLCDCNLGGESGSGLLQRITSSKGSQSPRFVLMTGELLDANQVSSWEKKGARVLQKPFQISELVAVLGGLLSAPAPELKSIER